MYIYIYIYTCSYDTGADAAATDAGGRDALGMAGLLRWVRGQELLGVLASFDTSSHLLLPICPFTVPIIW